MIRFTLCKFFLIATIISPFFFPSVGTADCDLEKTFISLKLVDKPVKDILKDIEKQAKYTIKVDDIKVLNSKKSIVLNQAPLNQALRRLLKDINYSIICNEEQKALTLVFLDKTNLPSSVSAKIDTDDSPTDPMDGIDKAFEEHSSNNPDQLYPELQDQEETSMDGATTAFEEYNNNASQAYPEPQDQEETSMDGATAAFEEYNNKGSQTFPEPQNQEETSMDGATEAFQESKNNMASQAVPEPQNQEETSMDGASTAFDEYYKLNKSN